MCRNDDRTPRRRAAAHEILPAPAARDLTIPEAQAAFDACQVVSGDAYAGWEPIFGVSLQAEAPPGVPMTWVAARRGDDWRADCALDSAGRQVGGGDKYGGKSTPNLLYALVDGQEGQGAGRMVDPVGRVTVQYEGEPEQDAVLRGGFWFFPIDEYRVDEGVSPDEADPSPAEYNLIGVPIGYVLRGYGADNELVYDSSRDGPTIDDCYADPTGTEGVGNHAGRDPAECVRTPEWHPGGD